jgi:DNA-binding transcriptional LysR family regulator
MEATVNLQRVRYFAAVARCESIRAAADSLNITQPSLSRQIQVLEREIGAPLLDRSGHRIALTPSGRMLMERAGGVLAEIESIRAEARRLSHRPGPRIALGVLQSLLLDTLPRALLDWRAEGAAAPVQVFGYRSHEIVEEVRRGTYDMGLVIVAPEDAGLAVEPLFEEPYVVLAAETDEFAGRPAITLRDLAGRDLLAMPRGYGVRDDIERALGELFDPRRLVAELESIDALTRLAEAGLGVCVLPASAARGAARGRRLARLPIAPVGPRRTILLVHRRDRPVGPAARRLLAAIVRCAAEDGGAAPARDETQSTRAPDRATISLQRACSRARKRSSSVADEGIG